jgi:hypothetical protein
MRDNHLDRFHKVDEPLEPVTMSNELGPDQLKLLALALIREDSVHAVQLLIPKLQLDWNLESLSASMGNSLDSEIIAETLARCF